MLIESDIKLTIDEEIVLWRSISRGDKKAFGNFFMKYYPLLYGYSRYYVSVEEAKEVLQELMMWLWENRVTFVPDTTSSLRQYLLTSVKRRCFNVLRRQEKETLEEPLWFEQEQNTFYEFIDLSVIHELQSLIQKAIDELPSSYRQAFTMHRFQNQTRQEIAETLKVSIKTVDYRIQQSLKILRERLKDYLPILTICSFLYYNHFLFSFQSSDDKLYYLKRNPWPNRKIEATAKGIAAELDKQEKKWVEKYPYVILSWRNNWDDLTVFFQFPLKIR